MPSLGKHLLSSFRMLGFYLLHKNLPHFSPNSKSTEEVYKSPLEIYIICEQGKIPFQVLLNVTMLNSTWLPQSEEFKAKANLKFNQSVVHLEHFCFVDIKYHMHLQWLGFP